MGTIKHEIYHKETSGHSQNILDLCDFDTVGEDSILSYYISHLHLMFFKILPKIFRLSNQAQTVPLCSTEPSIILKQLNEQLQEKMYSRSILEYNITLKKG